MVIDMRGHILPTLLIATCILALTPGGLAQPQSNPPERHLYKVVNRNGKTGFVDQTGQLVIGFDRFPGEAEIREFHEGLAAMCFPGPGHYCRAVGFVDRNGEMAIAPHFKNANGFSEGLAYVETDEMRGFIDRNGKVVIRLAASQRLRMDGFHEGRAIIFTPEGQEGFIDRTGKVVVEPRYSFISPFSEGLAAVISGDPRQAKYGFINPKGETVIPPRFEARIDPGWPYAGGNVHLSRFSEGLACVRVRELYGYINKKGEFVIPPKFALAGDFSEGLASAVENGKVGYIDKRGRWVIRPGFDNPYNSIHRPFGDGLAPVAVITNHQTRWGYVDKTGKMVIQPAFSDAFSFNNGVARVTVLDRLTDNLALRYIDKTGRFIWEPK